MTLLLLNDVIKLQVLFSKILAEPRLGPPQSFRQIDAPGPKQYCLANSYAVQKHVLQLILLLIPNSSNRNFWRYLCFLSETLVYLRIVHRREK